MGGTPNDWFKLVWLVGNTSSGRCVTQPKKGEPTPVSPSYSG